MYIHNYQIHNVLNVYRNQLTKVPGVAIRPQAPAATGSDQVKLSKSHRRYLMDRVSAEIVERISQAEPQKQLHGGKNDAAEKMPESGIQNREAAFTYTAIDENNRKISNTLPIEKLSPLIGR